jgi:hypothetical protein
MLEGARARVGLIFGFIVLLCMSCDGRVPELAKNSEVNPPEANTFFLDAQHPTLVQAIRPSDRAADYKFVQVEVFEVQNPKGHAATFKVEYQTKAGEKIFLGSFSLYPSDQPGKFIVATQAKVGNDGAIVLSLIVPDELKSGEVLRAGVRKIRFVNE